MDNVNRYLRVMTVMLVFLALAFSGALIIRDAGMDTLPALPHGVIGAAPLLLVGAAFLMLQIMIRPELNELLKNLLLAGTFILWGIVQLMPQNVLSMRLGNLVVVLYVLDIAWVILVSVSPMRKSDLAREGAANHRASREVTDERA